MYRPFSLALRALPAYYRPFSIREDQHRFGDSSDRAQAVFVQLKSKMSSPAFLSFPRHILPFVLDTDIFDTQFGCVLIHPDDKKSLRSVGCWSRTLCSAKLSYNTTGRECMDIVWAVLLLWPYLLYKMLLVRTDQVALRWVLNLTRATGRQAPVTTSAGIRFRGDESPRYLPSGPTRSIGFTRPAWTLRNSHTVCLPGRVGILYRPRGQ